MRPWYHSLNEALQPRSYSGNLPSHSLPDTSAAHLIVPCHQWSAGRKEHWRSESPHGQLPRGGLLKLHWQRSSWLKGKGAHSWSGSEAKAKLVPVHTRSFENTRAPIIVCEYEKWNIPPSQSSLEALDAGDRIRCLGDQNHGFSLILLARFTSNGAPQSVP